MERVIIMIQPFISIYI
jgi:hypothetical protein